MASRWRNFTTGEFVVGAGAVVVVLALAGVLVVLAARSPSQGGSGEPLVPTTTTAAPSTTTATSSPGAPVITSFNAPARVRCSITTRVEVSWSTRNAVGVELGVDGPGTFLFSGPEGSAKLPFACDGLAHTYTLKAAGPRGPPAVRTITVVQA